jgi:acetoin utilization protein AcuB
MRRNVETIGEHESADQAWECMRSKRIHHLVVARGPGIVGILSDRDIGGPFDPAYRKGRAVGDVMTPSVVSARPETTIREAANLLRGRSIGSLPILEDGKIVGIVTTTDLLTLIGKGAERPIATSRRWTMKGRGPRRRPINPR